MKNIGLEERNIDNDPDWITPIVLLIFIFVVSWLAWNIVINMFKLTIK